MTTATAHPEQAERCLARALALVSRDRGRRDEHRALLARAIELAARARDAAAGDACDASDAGAASDASDAGDLARAGAVLARAYAVLARAYAARAEDARHGAGQLSLSAQRAPTPDACDDGWRRVEEIVRIAEAAARDADDAARAIPTADRLARAAIAAAGRAAASARAARAIVGARNDAYTFHTSPGFSFGEGWYLAAAALLGGVAIQIEPGPQAAQAERFLRDAGLGDRLRPPRPRPRANKQTTDVVARAFRASPREAQRRLRAAFLGDAPIAPEVRAWIDARVVGHGPKVLLWVRDGRHHAHRNTRAEELAALARLARGAGLVPILVGDAVRDGPAPEDAVDLIHFWKDPVFRGEDARRAQLQLFEHLRAAHAVVGQLGVTTAGMDGPALMGMPTMYLTDAPNPRMGAWVGAVPGYEEIVREDAYRDRIGASLSAWARAT